MRLHHGAGGFVVVIRMSELQLGSKVALAGHLQRLDFTGAVALGIPGVKILVACALALALAHPGGSRLKGVQIKMKGKSVERLAGEIVVGERLSRVESVAL